MQQQFISTTNVSESLRNYYLSEVTLLFTSPAESTERNLLECDAALFIPVVKRQGDSLHVGCRRFQEGDRYAHQR